MGGDHDERIGVRGGRLLGDGRSPVRVSGESCRTLQVIISTQKSFLAMCRIDAARDAIDLWAYVSCGMVQAGWCSWHVYGLTAIPRECDNPPKTQQNELCEDFSKRFHLAASRPSTIDLDHRTRLRAVQGVSTSAMVQGCWV